MIKLIQKTYYLILGIFEKSYFGFVQGHDYLSEKQVHELKELIGSANQESIRVQYVKEFKKKFNLNNVHPFASGRMAFFTMMKILDIREGDDIIITGFTCSVMINAILRVKATPVFTDIDEDTLGSSPWAIEKAITKKTKIIVAQHSFGIPCKMDQIVALGRKHNIFIIEDCAISIGSKYKGKSVGSFGDAAIFSTDHSKPLNTMIGGMLYVKDNLLFEKIELFMSNVPDLTIEHQKRLFKQFKFERLYFNPSMLLFGKIIQFVKRIILRTKSNGVFLDQDYSSKISLNQGYSYPAKLPGFIAKLGLYELGRWHGQCDVRKKLLQEFLETCKVIGVDHLLPKAYSLSHYDIVPLRFVYSKNQINTDVKYIEYHIDTSWFWFREPIITCDSPQEFNYEYGSCPISERFGKQIINWPCNLDLKTNQQLISLFKKSIIVQ
jgi:perosamine synthetase